MDEKLINDILNCLKYQYLVDGAVVLGIAVSDLRNSLRGSRQSASCDVLDENGNLRRWSLPGSLSDFEYQLQQAGFEVAEGRNGRNQRTTVVYL